MRCIIFISNFPVGRLFNEAERKVTVYPLEFHIRSVINFATLIFCMQQVNIKSKEVCKIAWNAAEKKLHKGFYCVTPFHSCILLVHE
jgi:hypothetical protein